MNSYTVVMNAPENVNSETPHIACLETKIFARDFDEAVELSKLLKFEVLMNITSIQLDHKPIDVFVEPYTQLSR